MKSFTDLCARFPFTIPSGIITTVPSVIARIARDVPEIGFLTTKTISLEPREGYREPVLHEYYPGCFVNAVGLANPGARNFVDAMRPLLPLHDNKPLFVSIMGEDAEEFLACARILDPIADAFELNLSCPHVKGAGQSVGSDPDRVRSIIELLKHRLDKPIIPKLSPNLGDMAGMAKICRDAGADGLCLINTVGPGTACDRDGNPILSNVAGGLSGAGILPVGLKAVREAAGAVDIPIIASGGIGSADDVCAYRRAGASLFGIGSALAGMTTVQIVEFFASLGKSVNRVSEQREPLMSRTATSRMEYFKTQVKENTSFAHDLFRITLQHGGSCEPGCFFFLRLPGIGEKPFSPANDTEPSYLVRSVGPFTRALQSLEPGDVVYMRGPYGNGFPRPERGKRLILVSGGTGAAPIMMAASRWGETVSRAFFGFSTQVEPWFQDHMEKVFPDSRLVVDTPGEVGRVVRALEHDLSQQPSLYEDCVVYTCGPDPMMQAVARVLEPHVPRERILLAREDIMRCGIGICGSCGTKEGLRSCIDGPVMVAT
jgi:dihydroorotate dehydrogenase subfamily 1